MAIRKVRKAVIPAAGLGTRFLPATKAVPKEMLPIVDVPTLQLVVEEALSAGIEEIILVTGRGKGAIEDHFDRRLRARAHARAIATRLALLAEVERISHLVRLVSVRQKEPLGLGHAVLVAREAAGDEPVAVLLGDDLYDTDGKRPAIGQLVDAYERLGGEGIVALMEVAAGQEHLYGVVAGEAARRAPIKIHDMVEKPQPGTAPSRQAIVGRYVLPAEIWPILERTKPGKGGEIQLTDALRELAAGSGCYGLTVDGVRHDAGDKLGYLGANLAYALKRDDLRPGLLALMRRLVDEHHA